MIIAHFVRVLRGPKETLESNAKPYSVLKIQIVTPENLVLKTNVWMYVGWMEYVEAMQNVQQSTTPLYVPVMQDIQETLQLDAGRFSNVLFKMTVLIT